MSFTPHDNETLLDILIAARSIMTHAMDMDRDAFERDLRTQKAVLWDIVVIGEATKRLSGEFRAQHDAMAWSRMAGMRDVIVHGYDNIDIEIVWDVVIRDAPRLIAYLEPLLPADP